MLLSQYCFIHLLQQGECMMTNMANNFQTGYTNNLLREQNVFLVDLVSTHNPPPPPQCVEMSLLFHRTYCLFTVYFYACID